MFLTKQNHIQHKHATILFWFWLIFLLYPLNNRANAQNFNIDSFHKAVMSLSSDTIRINYIIDVSSALGCEDSLYKVMLVNEAKRDAEKIKWAAGISKSNRVLSDIYMYCEINYDSVIAVLKENIKLFEKTGDVTGQSFALEDIAKKYDKMFKQDKSIEYLTNALLLNNNSADRRIVLLADLGYEYGYINDFPNAITYYDSSLKVIEAEVKRKKMSDKGDTDVRVGLLLNMADIYLSMPDPVKALINYQQVLTISERINNKRFIILSLVGIGNIYEQQKQYSRAIEYFQKALAESRAINRFNYEATVLNALANTYLDSGLQAEAKTFAEDALDLAERQNITAMLPRVNATLGNVLLKKGDAIGAITHLQKSLELSKKLVDQRDALFGLSSAYKQAGKYDMALAAFERYVNVRDSVKRIENTNEAIRKDLNTTYEKEKAIREAEYKKDIQRQSFFTFGGFFGLALVLLLSVFIYRNYSTQKKYNKLLSKEKKGHLAHIEQQSHVLSDIAQIQAHEVRGPVSAILGFVQMFNTEDISDPSNKEVIEWIGVAAEKLDGVVRNVVSKENDLYEEHKDDHLAGNAG